MRNRKRLWRLLILIGVIAIVAAACGGNDQSSTGSESTTTAPSSTSASADGWTRDYEGTTLSVIAEATLNTEILRDLIPDFTEKTGIEVTLEEAPYDNLVQKTTLDLSTGQGGYDVISLPYEFIGAYAENGWLAPVDDRLAATSSFAPGFDPAAIIPAMWRESSVWRDVTYGMPSNSAVMMMFYRKDLIENPDEQAAFQAKYGYPLAIPETWSQYRDVAEFFNRPAGEMLAGQELQDDFHGVAMTGKRHVATVLEWMDYGWTFGGGIFNDAGDLVIDSPESIAALDYMIGLTDFAQPGYTNATWDETTAALQQGIAALSITWGDTAGAMEDPEQSVVVGAMGYASIPVENEGESHVAHLGSWTYVIPDSSTKQDAAWLFMQWALSEPIQLELGKRGGLPSLTSVFEDPGLVSTLPYWSQELISLTEAKSRPRIPEWGEISDTLQEQISNAISGQVSATDALTAAGATLRDLLQGQLPLQYK
jgi:multiple sugar transport system substrate-binding protein